MVLFENRTWHAGGLNRSGHTRLAVMMQCGYRCLNAVDDPAPASSTDRTWLIAAPGLDWVAPLSAHGPAPRTNSRWPATCAGHQRATRGAAGRVPATPHHARGYTLRSSGNGRPYAAVTGTHQHAPLLEATP
ncbi:hypothetical protein GCM10010519_00660 [Streptomyces lactacystinicus]